MRALIFIASLFAVSVSFGQDSLEKKVSSDVCNCIDHSNTLTEKEFLNCFQAGITKNSDLFIKECIALYNDTTYETGYKFGQELFGRISVSMIYSCKSYYHLMDTLRYTELRGLNKDSIKNVILDMNKSDPQAWNSAFFTERGVMYFQISELENALSDFNNAIRLDQNAIQSMYFKAWVLEIKGNYDEAFLLYSALAISIKKTEFNIFAAIAKQKKSGL
jgi:tetratricopeptide (TPR) repeat protein